MSRQIKTYLADISIRVYKTISALSRGVCVILFINNIKHCLLIHTLSGANFNLLLLKIGTLIKALYSVVYAFTCYVTTVMNRLNVPHCLVLYLLVDFRYPNNF